MYNIAFVSIPFLLAISWVISDYRAWIAFGTGGSPPTPGGYLKSTKFRILRAWAGDDLKDASSLSAEKGPHYLTGKIPKRQGPPPQIISRTLPQRQVPHEPRLDTAAYDYLHALPRKYATSLTEHLYLEPSITEGRTTDAIYAKDKNRKCGAYDPILGDEIAHVHPAENSLHVWLTQADAKIVIEAGWGERFPLASLGMVDPGWIFVFAPRNMNDVLVVEEIVKAGVGHLTEKRV